MTVAGRQGEEHARSTERSWHLSLLAETEPGRRNRRTIDAFFLLVGALVVGLTAVVAPTAESDDRNVAQALVTILGWADSLWRIAFVGLLAFALVIVVDVLVRRRWSLARDLIVAASLVVAAGSVLGGIVESDWLPIESHLLSHWGFPELRLASAVASLVVAGPELVRLGPALLDLARPVRRRRGGRARGSALPSGVLGALALGLGAGALVRLAFGSAAGVPPHRARARRARLARCRGRRPARSRRDSGSARRSTSGTTRTDAR